jgi:hypothetical protein
MKIKINPISTKVFNNNMSKTNYMYFLISCKNLLFSIMNKENEIKHFFLMKQRETAQWFKLNSINAALLTYINFL